MKIILRSLVSQNVLKCSYDGQPCVAASVGYRFVLGLLVIFIFFEIFTISEAKRKLKYKNGNIIHKGIELHP